ncbi:MAG: conjugal transfer protein TraX [Candidatus Bathyarchaeota archaeon]|nr:conjugal transfer protein TraX [Candidatus Bathyarchaeota archaeon]
MYQQYDPGRDILKILAIITMTIDHIGAIFYPTLDSLRIIGRIAFPLYCYLLVLGVESTHSIKNYFLRLVAFAFISQIPFFLALNYEPLSLNIFFTLAAGISILVQPTLALIPIFLSLLIDLDYGAYGFVLIACLNLIRKNLKVGVFASGVLHIITAFTLQIYALLALPFILLHHFGYLSGSQLIATRPRFPTLRKYLFYAYYPLHLSVLYFIRVVSAA